MATLAPDIAEVERPRVSAATPARASGDRAATDGATLDDLIAGVWRSLTDERAAACPVCAAELTPRYGAVSRPVGGACDSCGAELT